MEVETDGADVVGVIVGLPGVSVAALVVGFAELGAVVVGDLVTSSTDTATMAGSSREPENVSRKSVVSAVDSNKVLPDGVLVFVAKSAVVAVCNLLPEPRFTRKTPSSNGEHASFGTAAYPTSKP